MTTVNPNPSTTTTAPDQARMVTEAVVVESANGKTNPVAPTATAPQQSHEGAVYLPSTEKEHNRVIGTGILFIKLGKTNFQGHITVPEKVTITVLFHGSKVDFSQAVFVHPVTTITVIGMFGGCEVILPAGVEADVTGAAIVGGFDSHETRADLTMANAPVVKVKGVVLFGGVSVKTSVITPPLTIGT